MRSSDVTLRRASLSDARQLYEMQLRAFRSLLEKYRDYATNPANEPMTKTVARLSDARTEYYFIDLDGAPVGAMRIRLLDDGIRLGPLWTMPEMRGRGIMQRAIKIIEDKHPEAGSWHLDTIKQEKGNCHLYEKIGYRLTGETEEINPDMTLVMYRK